MRSLRVTALYRLVDFACSEAIARAPEGKMVPERFMNTVALFKTPRSLAHGDRALWWHGIDVFISFLEGVFECF